MENRFVFTDENGVQKVFYRLFYYELICLCVSDILNSNLVMNKVHISFLEFINGLSDYSDVDFLLSESMEYWALCIAENQKTIRSLDKEQNEKFRLLYSEYLKNKGIQDFIEQLGITRLR